MTARRPMLPPRMTGRDRLTYVEASAARDAAAARLNDPTLPGIIRNATARLFRKLNTALADAQQRSIARAAVGPQPAQLRRAAMPATDSNQLTLFSEAAE